MEIQDPHLCRQKKNRTEIYPYFISALAILYDTQKFYSQIKSDLTHVSSNDICLFACSCHFSKEMFVSIIIITKLRINRKIYLR